MVAVPGCVTVPERQPRMPLPAPAASAADVPVPVVQEPALEALTTVGPEPSAYPATPRTRHPAAPAAAPHRTASPAATRAGGANVCAWGERYGGWAPSGDAARICRDAYGR